MNDIFKKHFRKDKSETKNDKQETKTTYRRLPLIII